MSRIFNIKKDALFVIFLFCFLTLSFVIFIPGVVGGDSFLCYILAENIVKHGSLHIQNDLMDKYPGLKDALGFDNKANRYYNYTSYGVLLSLLMVPFYLIGMLVNYFVPSLDIVLITQLFVNMSDCFICALIGCFLFLISRRFGFDKKVSFFLVLIYSFCTINFNYAVLNFGEPLMTLCTLMAFYYIYIFKGNNKYFYLILSSIFLGLTVLIKFTNMMLIIPFLVYLALISPQKTRTVLKNCFVYASIFSFFIVILCVVNYFKTGFFFTSGYVSTNTKPNIAYIPSAFLGFFVSPGKSIFIFNLPLVLSLIYMKKFYKNFKNESILIIILFLINILLYGLFYFWYGGLCWGARYLMPMIVFLMLPFAYALKEFPLKKNIKYLVVALSLISLLIQLSSVLFPWFKIDNEIDIERQFYSFKHSQIANSFVLGYAYFYQKNTGKDLFITIDGKQINATKLTKLVPLSLKLLKGNFKRDNGEIIVLSKKVQMGIYLLFIFFIALYVFVLKKIRDYLSGDS